MLRARTVDDRERKRFRNYHTTPIKKRELARTVDGRERKNSGTRELVSCYTIQHPSRNGERHESELTWTDSLFLPLAPVRVIPPRACAAGEIAPGRIPCSWRSFGFASSRQVPALLGKSMGRGSSPRQVLALLGSSSCACPTYIEHGRERSRARKAVIL